MEAVELRKRGEKSVAHEKFNNSAFILDEILERQRPPCDKSGLGYNKEDEKQKVGTWTSRKHGTLKQQSKKNEATEKVVFELKPQLEEKENEIKKLNTEVNDQTEETKKLHDQLSKSFEDLEETRKINVILKTQFEEAKRIGEVLQNQLYEKEKSCHKLEMEVVELIKRVEKSGAHEKFNNNAFISWMRFLNVRGHHVTNPDLDTRRKMRSIKLGHGPLGSMKQTLHSERMEVKLQGTDIYKARKP